MPLFSRGKPVRKERLKDPAEGWPSPGLALIPKTLPLTQQWRRQAGSVRDWEVSSLFHREEREEPETLARLSQHVDRTHWDS